MVYNGLTRSHLVQTFEQEEPTSDEPNTLPDPLSDTGVHEVDASKRPAG